MHKIPQNKEPLKEKDINKKEPDLKYTSDRMCYLDDLEEKLPLINDIPIQEVHTDKESYYNFFANKYLKKEKENLTKNESVKNNYYENYNQKYNFNEKNNNFKERENINFNEKENYFGKKKHSNYNNFNEKNHNFIFNDKNINFKEKENNFYEKDGNLNEKNSNFKDNYMFNQNYNLNYQQDYFSNKEEYFNINNDDSKLTNTLNTKDPSYLSIKKQIDLDLLILNRYLYSDKSKEILERIKNNTNNIKKMIIEKAKNKFKERILSERNFYEEKIKKLENKIKKYKKILFDE
ncbi:hypothetical protein TUBRATIS_27530 [Tubulinosema ratisbonensis]|uniref:Uncharacterized protein n=1 Tax=Tubulinosema ratisbonensis TaxID=291195 RepID=A0A437AID1_9MICR|nr:hypothetical protein TUBRATIS_27530 [Tubulinosema ratisbonensis]